MNTITVHGNLTDEPTLRYSNTGTAVLRFCVAVTRRSYDRQSGEWVTRPPVFHRVVAFGMLAENAATLATGTAVTVIGELADDSWITDTGQTRRQVQLEAADIAVSLRFATLEDRRRARAVSVITKAWPGELGEAVLHAVQDLDTFGALAYDLDRARLNGADPVAILHRIDTDTLTWAITEANNPAAFLASRITDTDGEQPWWSSTSVTTGKG